MKILRKAFCVILMTAPLAGPSLADNSLSIGAKVGTLGIGLEASWHPLPWFDLRAGVNKYVYDDSGSQAGINYDAELNLDTIFATLNFRFPMSPMRLTIGAFQNNNELLLVSQDTPTFDIGGTTYTAADVGTLRSVTAFDGTAPYAGVGFDFTVLDKIGLNVDFGVLWQGGPTVTLDSDGLLASDPIFQSALESERQELQNEVEDFKAWPVLSLGVSYHFF